MSEFVCVRETHTVRHDKRERERTGDKEIMRGKRRERERKREREKKREKKRKDAEKEGKREERERKERERERERGRNGAATILSAFTSRGNIGFERNCHK